MESRVEPYAPKIATARVGLGRMKSATSMRMFACRLTKHTLVTVAITELPVSKIATKERTLRKIVATAVAGAVMFVMEAARR